LEPTDLKDCWLLQNVKRLEYLKQPKLELPSMLFS
jgi:hypothetical protein